MANILAVKSSTPRGTLADLDETIECATKSIDALPANDWIRGVFLQELASWLVKRYERTGALADLCQAIRHGQQAVDALGGDRASQLKSLGVMYGMRSVRTRKKEDLERAIRY